MEGLSLLLKKGLVEGKLTGIKVSRIINIFHLFFVDHVLIMTNDSLHEWKDIKAILKTFCSASSLLINWTKTTFHYVGIQEHSLALLKDLFPHNFVHLADGFRYLGYYIKANSYKVTVWNWLVARVEKRIGHSCNRWLSLGGRHTLIKVVLEGQSVYWMTLAAIPSTVLDKLRKLTYNFLWSSSSYYTHLHLSNLESLAKPKIKGGWGIWNLFHFNIAMETNSLWRVLRKDGI
jgi:hypothetical protein